MLHGRYTLYLFLYFSFADARAICYLFYIFSFVRAGWGEINIAVSYISMRNVTKNIFDNIYYESTWSIGFFVLGTINVLDEWMYAVRTQFIEYFNIKQY